MGWLRGFRQNQIGAARKATLSPTLSRRAGEGGRLRQMEKGIEGDGGGCEMFAVI